MMINVNGVMINDMAYNDMMDTIDEVWTSMSKADRANYTSYDDFANKYVNDCINDYV